MEYFRKIWHEFVVQKNLENTFSCFILYIFVNLMQYDFFFPLNWNWQQTEKPVIFSFLVVMRLLVDILKHHSFENCNNHVYSLQVHLLAGNECIISQRKKSVFCMNTYITSLFNCIRRQFSITFQHFFNHSAFPL